MKLFAVYFFSTNSQQADLIHKYDGPARRTRWARAACAGEPRSSATRAEIRYLYFNQNQHNYLYCTHENGEQFGVDVLLHMPAVAGDNLPRTVHCCYVYLA
jgi:hypothetical protein